MTKIIELAHALGEQIAVSEEMKALAAAKDAYDQDSELQALVSEYETERSLLGKEFSKETDQVDTAVVEALRKRIDELTKEICQRENYVAFANAQNKVNELMNSVNAEIKFCITGERPSTCTHDCSTCGGCSH